MLKHVYHAPGEKRRLPFLDLMMEACHNGTAVISDLEIKEQVDTIMFEVCNNALTTLVQVDRQKGASLKGQRFQLLKKQMSLGTRLQSEDSPRRVPP